MAFVIRKAERRKAKLRLGLAAPSGAGKTYSALMLAFGIGGKIGVIATEQRVTGIQIWYQNNPKVYYNSVYLSGTGTNISGSAALFIGSAAGVDARNNILVNTRDESPYCASVIRIYSGSPLTMSNFNDLYYEPNQYNCLVSVVGTDYHTLAEWQATGKDLESISELPYFISSTDLHIDKTYSTNLERGATPVASITTDFDGDLRNAATPDIGADEFDGYTFEDPLPAGTYAIGLGGNFILKRV